MSMQSPTGQPNWPTPQPTPPPRRRRGWLARLAVLACAAVGWFLGATAGALFGLQDMNVGTVLMLVGMWVGFCLGLWFGLWMTRPKTRQPLDPAQYPNQLFRRV